MTESERAPQPILAAMLLVAASVLVLQIASTRVLSATVSYHSAFAVIALVMLGLATSSTAVFIHRQREGPGLARTARALAIGGLVCCVTSLGIVWIGALGIATSAVTMLTALVLFYSTFYFCGYAVASLLAEYSRDVGRVYWFDLSGAAMGCVAAVWLLDLISAFLVILLCGVAVAVAGVLIASIAHRYERTTAGALALVIVVNLIAVTWPNTVRLHTAKGQQAEELWERWNQLARITVGDEIPNATKTLALLEPKVGKERAQQLLHQWTAGWGMSELYNEPPPPTLWMQLDADAGTQIIRDGTRMIGDLDFLSWDVTSAAHHLRRGKIERAFVVGGGGGRDILTALHFGAERVDVVELNPGVVEAVQTVFGAYSGRPYTHPRVALTNGEARSVLSRSDATYDLIQTSMIDTWAASMAGAMVLSENTLYTREAYVEFMRHLKPDGMLTISRWYDEEQYGQAARVMVLMADALRLEGGRPADRIAVVIAEGQIREVGVATAILKRSPFTDHELEALAALSHSRRFRVLWPPLSDALTIQDPPFDVAAMLAGDPKAIDDPRFDLSVPTDDRPFFFNVDRPFKSWILAARMGDASVGSRATFLFAALLLLVAIAGRAFVHSPLIRANKALPESQRVLLRNHVGPIAYFAGIGLGFMFTEIALIQRYLVYLGHPTYALSVVLCTLLLAGGAGSAVSARLRSKQLAVALGALLVGIAITALGVPTVTAATHGWSLAWRVTLAVGLIAPLGLFMGMIFTLGVRRLTGAGLDHLVPWVWAINALLGVFGSVCGMLMAMLTGYTSVLLIAAVAYATTAWSTTIPWAADRP